jgi:membrane associated rhomboid family serine protease
LGADWFDRGRAQAGLMSGGEWWRAVTALTLHVDSRHLLGNLLFGSVLGFLAAQGLGGGGAWLAIVVGGALGNVVNALLQDPAHSAVGASTAVFAALGTLVALALRYNREREVSAARRWSPLVAGLLLLGWTGMGGERTDVWAHVAGLATGMLVGAVCGFAPPGLLERRGVQGIAWLLAALIVLVAWGLALA